VDVEGIQRELLELRHRVRTLEGELEAQSPAGHNWPPRSFYGAYYATTGFMLGALGAAVSLLANVIGAPIAGKRPLELIQVFLTFPLGERALSLDTETNGGLIIAMGCCLYLATGMLLGVPVYVIMARVCGSDSPLAKRLVVGGIAGLGLWVIAFYGILSWLQPLLFEGRWITDPAVLPPWVAAVTHVIFGWTLAIVYPWGQFTPYRSPSEQL
jgi:hypothetical protein